jgi:hypothetical protein
LKGERRNQGVYLRLYRWETSQQVQSVDEGDRGVRRSTLLYTYIGNIKWKVENEKKVIVPVLEEVDMATIYATQKRLWEKLVDRYVKRDIKLSENCEKQYSLISGHSTCGQTWSRWVTTQYQATL